MPKAASLGQSPRYWREGVSFIKAELNAGIGFSMIALSSRDREKIARNTGYARSAFDVAGRFVKKVRLRAEDAIEVDQGFQELRANLVRLENILNS